MSAWPSLASNEQVTHDEVQWAVANNYLAIRPGQTADTGNECISSPQAIGWLLIDSDYMPPLDRGEMPIRGDFVPLPATVRAVVDETYTPRIDINLFVGIDNNIIANPPYNFDQTFTVKGGTVLAAVVQSLEASSAVNAKKHLRVSNDSGVVLDTSNPNLDPNIVWSLRIAPGSNWLIEAFGSADAVVVVPPPQTFIYTNNTGSAITYSVFNTGSAGESPTMSGSLASNESMNVVPYIPGPSGNNYVIQFFSPGSGKYSLTQTPDGSTSAVTASAGGVIIASINSDTVEANIANGLTGVAFTFSALVTRTIKIRFYSKDGYPGASAFLQVVDTTTGQFAPIYDYASGIWSDRIYNPGSYSLNYLQIVDDGNSLNYFLTDMGQVANAASYIANFHFYQQGGSFIDNPPMSVGKVITIGPGSKILYDDDDHRLEITISKSSITH
jgi:hypothetical protein